MSNRTLIAVLFLAALGAVVAGTRARRGAPPPPARAERIVSLVPGATEVLFDLGLGDRVVGVTSWCRHPEEARRKTVVGDFVSPNVEVILGLRPDAVIESATHPAALEKLRAAGLPVVEVRVATLADALEQYDVIGAAAGVAERAREARARLERALEEESARHRGAARVRAALVIERAGDAAREVYVVGGRGFLSELAARAGIENVFHDLAREYERVSVEEFYRRAPELILEFRSQDPPTDAEALAVWSRLGPEIPAVRGGRVRVVTEDCMLQPGPRMATALRVLAEAAR